MEVLKRYIWPIKLALSWQSPAYWDSLHMMKMLTSATDDFIIRALFSDDLEKHRINLFSSSFECKL